MEPRIQYAKTSDGLNVAYAVFGSGPAIVFPGNIWGSLHLFKNEAFDLGAAPPNFNEISSLGWSVITYDGRGTGSSDRDTDDWTLNGRLRDLEAVVERAAPTSFALCGQIQGGPAAVAYAVQHPDRVSRLVLCNTYAAGSEWYGLVPALRSSRVDLMLYDAEGEWAFATLALANATTDYTDSERARRLAEVFRTGMTAKGYVAYRDASEKIDVRELLPQISMPTLVIHDRNWLVEGIGVLAQRLAPLIPNARFVETDDFVRVVDEFLREGEATPRDATLASGTAIILFADVVDSTAQTERLGDAAFRGKARDLDESLRKIIREAEGTPVEGKLLGDGVMSVFTSAKNAIDAAMRFGEAGEAVGLALHVGIHAGDVIEEDGNVFGGAVNIAARVAAESAPGEVLVSQTVRDLARTSAGVAFEDAGERTLKGVGEPVRVWRVTEA